MPVVGWNMLHDVVGGRAQDVFRAIGLVFRNTRGPNISFEEIDSFGHLLHQRSERGARQSDAQATKQQQQWAGGSHDRIGVRRHEFGNRQGSYRRGGRGLRVDGCCRGRDPLFWGRRRRCRCIGLRWLERWALRSRAGGPSGRRWSPGSERWRSRERLATWRLVGQRRRRQPASWIGPNNGTISAAKR